MSKTFTQSEWGRVEGISMAASGCGPCSTASIIYNKDMNINPRKTAEWLYDHGHFYSSGTTRSGISALLNAYGFDVDYYTPEHTGGSSWENAIEKLKNAKEELWAIFLVVGKSNGGKDDLWTSGGHFLAITDYSNGKVYVRDSGARGRTGYYDPELLRYDTNCIWIIKKKSAKKAYTGTFPVLPAKNYLCFGDKGTAVKNLQLFLMWYGVYAAKIDSDFGKKTLAAVTAYQKAEKLEQDGCFGPACLARAKTVKK